MLNYGPGGGSDESGQLLSYRVGAIPSVVTMSQADGSDAGTADTR